MGQSLSVDFRQCVARMHKRTIAVNDHDHWKVFFLTNMSSDDIATYLTPLDVRMLRRAMPQNLAALLYTAMQQLATFLHDAEANLSVDTAATGRRSVVDECAVLNAIRIIAACMPYVLEEDICEPAVEDRSVMFPKVPLPVSPHARNFAEQFFWRNDACRPVGEAAVTLPPVLRDGPRGQPLGAQLMVLLTRLCFVPTWTIDKSVALLRRPIDFNSPALADHHVIGQYLLCPGLFQETVKDGALFFAREVKWRRYELLRCIVACLTTPVAVGRSLERNPFLDVLVDEGQNDLAPTLCCSLVNYVSQYVSRGVMPFSSHVWTELPEAFLADSLQLLALCTVDWTVSGDARAAGPSESVAPPQKKNCFRHFTCALAKDANTASFYAHGVFRVLENPLFAATTKLKNSQHRLNCVSEALNLAVRLASLPEADGYLRAFSGMTEALLFPVLFYLRIAKAGRRYFADAQAALYLLTKLSASPVAEEFNKALTSTFAGVMPFSDLPAVEPDATLGDVLCLALCDLISPGTPRWLQPLANTAAVILVNVSPVVTLRERQCFEFFHVLDYVTSPAFDRQAPRACNKEHIILNVLDAMVALCTHHADEHLPLLAALSTIDLPGRIAVLTDPDAPPPAEEASTLSMMAHTTTRTPSARAPKDSDEAELIAAAHLSTKGLLLSDDAKQRLPLAALNVMSELAHRVVESLPSADDEPVEALRASVNAGGLPAPHVVDLQDLVLTDELKQYLTSSLWAVIHEHHARPPLFDFSSSKLFRAAPRITEAAMAALAQEDTARIAAVEDAARAARRDQGQ
jgi:hypothetical protein